MLEKARAKAQAAAQEQAKAALSKRQAGSESTSDADKIAARLASLEQATGDPAAGSAPAIPATPQPKWARDSDADHAATFAQLKRGESGEQPTIVRTYPDNAEGREQLRQDTVDLGNRGYQPATQSSEKGKVKTRSLLLTGGIGAAVGYARGKGGIHEIGTITATFTRRGPAARSTDIAGQLRSLVELRDSGALTPEEFGAAKERLLGR